VADIHSQSSGFKLAPHSSACISLLILRLSLMLTHVIAGEDMFLTSIMGVNYAWGLSKNGSWSSPDAVIPVMKVSSSYLFPLPSHSSSFKHFAGHGSPSGGVNAAPYMGYGIRQIITEMLTPFKAAVQLGGVKGVMMYRCLASLRRYDILMHL
jgi:beta-glucosidase-like glycosyl hydrolase